MQVSGSHQIQLCRKGTPPTSLILPDHHHVVLPQPLHSRVSVTATGLTRASVLALAATYHPRHLRKWVRGLPHALPAAVVRKLTWHPATAGPCPDPPLSDRTSPRPDIVTLNVQMSLRPKLRALDVLIREYQYPLTLHVQEAGPLIVQRVHPLYHTIQAPARVAGGCATLLYRAPDLTVPSHNAHPSGRACRYAAAERWICCWALSPSVRTMSRSRLRDSRSPCATVSVCRLLVGSHKSPLWAIEVANSVIGWDGWAAGNKQKCSTSTKAHCTQARTHTHHPTSKTRAQARLS